MKAVVLGKLVIEKPKLRYVSEEESQARLDSAGIKHLRYLRDQSTDNLRLSDDCVRRASKALQDDLMSISGIENNTVDDILRVVMLSTIKTEKEDDVPSGWDPFTVRFGEFRMERRRKRRPPSLPLKVWDDSHHSYSMKNYGEICSCFTGQTPKADTPTVYFSRTPFVHSMKKNTLNISKCNLKRLSV